MSERLIEGGGDWTGTSAPPRHWRTAVGEVIQTWDGYDPRPSFGYRARIRTGRTTKRVLWSGPFRRTDLEAMDDLRRHPKYPDLVSIEDRP